MNLGAPDLRRNALHRSREGWYTRLLGAMKLPEPSSSALEQEVFAGIKLLETKIQGLTKPDGIVSPTGNTIVSSRV